MNWLMKNLILEHDTQKERKRERESEEEREKKRIDGRSSSKFMNDDD